MSTPSAQFLPAPTRRPAPVQQPTPEKHGVLSAGESAPAGLPLYLNSGHGPDARNFGGGSADSDSASVTIQGETTAKFKDTYRQSKFKSKPVAGNTGNPATDKFEFSGDLVSTFKVATNVHLPRASDYPKLSPSQRKKIQAAIKDVLAPHEQKHVDAFKTYNGTETQPFNVTMTQAEFAAAMKKMHQNLAKPREDSARAASDALDPFSFDVDLGD